MLITRNRRKLQSPFRAVGNMFEWWRPAQKPSLFLPGVVNFLYFSFLCMSIPVLRAHEFVLYPSLDFGEVSDVQGHEKVISDLIKRARADTPENRREVVKSHIEDIEKSIIRPTYKKYIDSRARISAKTSPFLGVYGTNTERRIWSLIMSQPKNDWWDAFTTIKKETENWSKAVSTLLSSSGIYGSIYWEKLCQNLILSDIIWFGLQHKEGEGNKLDFLKIKKTFLALWAEIPDAFNLFSTVDLDGRVFEPLSSKTTFSMLSRESSGKSIESPSQSLESSLEISRSTGSKRSAVELSPASQKRVRLFESTPTESNAGSQFTPEVIDKLRLHEPLLPAETSKISERSATLKKSDLELLESNEASRIAGSESSVENPPHFPTYDISAEEFFHEPGRENLLSKYWPRITNIELRDSAQLPGSFRVDGYEKPQLHAISQASDNIKMTEPQPQSPMLMEAFSDFIHSQNDFSNDLDFTQWTSESDYLPNGVETLDMGFSHDPMNENDFWDIVDDLNQGIPVEEPMQLTAPIGSYLEEKPFHQWELEYHKDQNH
ncbi:hypothetical protein O181_009033 [Austropuccinia psidii MF-1]|uniref:Uncharacterized protein n=1 Tax=Austropuccinia psidii MF-1 TaxID=1389203 RepID=A0A9Q3BQK4_9BASI|nr:hypothetical protein [Austropuccinia psidii MF-1]